MQSLLVRPADAVTELGQAAALPRLVPSLAAGLSRVFDHAAPLRIALRDAPARLHWRAPISVAPRHESCRFRFGTHTGHVGVDVPAAARLVGEPRIDLLPRELRYVLWADALHGLVTALESATHTRLEWLPPNADAPHVEPDALRAAFFCIEGDADAAPSAAGFVQFDDDAALSSVLLPALRMTDAMPATAAQQRVLDGLRVPLPFALGRTAITLREVRGVRRGDIVGIEGWQSAGSALRVTAEVGGALGIAIAALAEGTHITVQTVRDPDMNRDALPDSGQLALDRLDGLEVNLRFEVGELSLTLGELRAIKPGHVFDLEQPLNRCEVRILAHGNVLGKGHLVAVGERLGVRVSEFAPGEL